MARRYPCAGQGGFTLIEVLIALAITSMVVSVLMASVFYGSKVQSGIRQELVERERSLRTKAWFTEMLGSCLPADFDSGAAFQGGSQEISCDSLMPLQGRAFLPAQRIRLTLRAGPTNSTQLVYRQSGLADTEQIITELPYPSAAFSYVGSNGKEVAKWPVAFHDPETLPRRIRLVSKPLAGEATGLEWSVSVRASPWLEPVLKNPFGLALPK